MSESFTTLAPRRRLSLVVLWFLGGGSSPALAGAPPVYLWLEPEWFVGVKGNFSYWSGTGKPTGAWGISGPGLSAEWTQGGESEWNSMAAAAEEKSAFCHRDLTIPRDGTYRIWVRYVDHRGKSEPFKVGVQQNKKTVAAGELGGKDVVPPNDEYQLYWGFSFGWDSIEAKLGAGAARLALFIDRPGEAWRQVDAVLITDDLQYRPVAREKPPFGYLATTSTLPTGGAAWRGSARELPVGASWRRGTLGGRDFSMWAGTGTDPEWWGKQPLDQLKLYDVFFQFSPPYDIKEQFQKQFAGKKDIPLMSWPGLLPGFYLTDLDLSPGTALRAWLEKTRTPFFVLTNYAKPHYTEKTGPGTYEALSGPLAEQFLGFIHGETFGSPGVQMIREPLGKTRREHVDGFGQSLVKQQEADWSKIFKTPVPSSFWSKGISCLASDLNIALAHELREAGSTVVGYEEDSTNVHVPLRIAFERGAARQYGGPWINYASSNFGDACNSFTQKPVVPRGAGSWFHSKYAVTDGVSATWYRKLYYLNYLGGAAAIYWEQNLANQWILPGPGQHPIELSPFGRATEEFQSFVDRLPDRGEPYTPVAFLLSAGHAYGHVNYTAKMLDVFTEDSGDRELRELWNVAWYPSGVLEGQPAAPDVQSMPGGQYGNIFDVLVDRPARARAIFDYPVVYVTGDVSLGGDWQAVLRDYLRRGGTLVVNIESAGKLAPELLGLRPTGKRSISQEWAPAGEAPRATTPYPVAGVELAGAEVLAWAGARVPLLTRNVVGEGAVLVTLVPRMLGLDERAHPALPYLMNGLTAGLLPIEVRLASGERPAGEVMYQVNRNRDGWLVMLVNNRGVDKTPSGVARVDRRAFVDVVLRSAGTLRSARELTQPRDLPLEGGPRGVEVHVRVHPGDVQVVELSPK